MAAIMNFVFVTMATEANSLTVACKRQVLIASRLENQRDDQYDRLPSQSFMFGKSWSFLVLTLIKPELCKSRQCKLPTPETHGETGSVHPKRSQKATLQHVKQKN